MLLCYTAGLIDTTLAGFNTRQSPAYTAVSNIFLLTLFIMAAGPGSGGHVQANYVAIGGNMLSFPGEPGCDLCDHPNRAQRLG